LVNVFFLAVETVNPGTWNLTADKTANASGTPVLQNAIDRYKLYYLLAGVFVDPIDLVYSMSDGNNGDAKTLTLDLGDILTINGINLYYTKGYFNLFEATTVSIAMADVGSAAASICTSLQMTERNITDVLPALTMSCPSPMLGRFIYLKTIPIPSGGDFRLYQITVNLAGGAAANGECSASKLVCFLSGQK
jgi:hypothetical protein